METTNNVSLKTCNKCGIPKPIGDFYTRKDRKNGFGYCKTCCNKFNSQYYFNNVEKTKNHKKEYCLKNKDKIKARASQYYFTNKEKFYTINKKWRQEHLKNDINFKIICIYRNRVYDALKNNHKAAHTAKLIMCSILQLRLHIEKQWLPGMSWNNWGWGKNKWHIDHIIPCSFFNMSDPVEQFMCFRWQNLQPLWQTDNFEKSDKVAQSSSTNKLCVAEIAKK